MATLTLDQTDIDFIKREMVDYEIPADKLEEVKQFIKNTMESHDYFHEEIRYFAEEMESLK